MVPIPRYNGVFFFTILFYVFLMCGLMFLPLWLDDGGKVGVALAMVACVLGFVIMIGNIVAGAPYMLEHHAHVETTEIALYQMSDYGDNIYVVTTIGDEIKYLVRCDTDNGPQYTEFDANHTTIIEDNCANPYMTFTHKWLDFPLNIIFPVSGHYKNDQYEIHVSMDKIKTLYH